MAAKAIDEGRIRTLAYHLWEQEGSPDGHAEDHWHRARTQLETEAGRDASLTAAAPHKAAHTATATASGVQPKRTTGKPAR